MRRIEADEPGGSGWDHRAAFGRSGWREPFQKGKTVNDLNACDVVTALWMARRETRKNRLGDLLRWANEVRGTKHGIHRR